MRVLVALLLVLLTPLGSIFCGTRFGETSIVLADALPPTKDAVRRHVHEYLSSIQSIHVKYQHWTTVWPDEKKHDGECGPQLIEWAEQGDMKLLKQGSFPEPGLPSMVSFMSFDGRHGFQVIYRPESANEIQSIHRTPQVNEFYQASKSFSPAVFSGQRCPNLSGSMLDFIDSPGTSVVGSEMIDGAVCVHLNSLDSRGESGIGLAVDVWLDVDMDWLPRRVIMKILESNSGIAKRFRGTERRYEISEFAEVTDALVGTSRKFPQVMRHIAPDGSMRLIVTDAHINSRLPESLFRPEMPKGTLVYDGDQAPYTPVKSFVVGGKDAVTQLIDKRIHSAVQLPVPNGPPFVDARIRDSVNWGWLLVIGSGILLVGVLAWRWFSRT